MEDRKGKSLQELPNVIWAYQTTECKATGNSPYELVYGTEEIGRQNRKIASRIAEYDMGILDLLQGMIRIVRMSTLDDFLADV